MAPHVQLWFTLHIICLISSCVPYLGGYLGQPCPKALFCILFATKRGGTGGGNDSVCISLWPVDCTAPNTPGGRTDKDLRIDWRLFGGKGGRMWSHGENGLIRLSHILSNDCTDI